MYKGTLERLDCEAELVAVKKLRADALSTTLVDFEREIAIMSVSFHLFQLLFIFSHVFWRTNVAY